MLIHWSLAIAFALMAMNPTVKSSSAKLTNLKCESHDLPFARFEKCKLNVVGRGIVALDIIVNLLKTPITNITLNFDFYKKASGYRPFLYNKSIDMCQYFRNQKRFPVLKFAFGFFQMNSNINHSCPYSGDVIVKNLVLEERNFKLLPLPDGEYLIKASVFAYNDLKATVCIFFFRKE